MKPDELSFVTQILVILTGVLVLAFLVDGQPIRAAFVSAGGGLLIGLVQLYVNYLRLYEEDYRE